MFKASISNMLFSGYLRLGKWRQLLLPKRVLRQYGYVQIIPRHPSVVKDGDLTTNEVVWQWLNFNDYVIQDMDVAPYLGACLQPYMEWFRSITSIFHWHGWGWSSCSHTFKNTCPRTSGNASSRDTSWNILLWYVWTINNIFIHVNFCLILWHSWL